MSNENEIYHTTFKFRFTSWRARWLPLWCHTLIARYYSRKARRSRPQKTYNTEISGTIAGRKTIQANNFDCSFSIDVSEELAKRLRTFAQQPTYSFEEAIVLIRNAESWEHLCLIGGNFRRRKAPLLSFSFTTHSQSNTFEEKRIIRLTGA